MGHKNYIREDGEALELDEEFFRTARWGRPPMLNGQLDGSVNLRLDADIIEFYRAKGDDWQARINADLRKAIKP